MGIYLIGYPGDVGGANAECWHTVKLWRKFGLDVTLIPTWGGPLPEFRSRCDEIGCRTLVIKQSELSNLEELKGAPVISFCNSEFLKNADTIRRMGCKIIWVGCMCWLFNEEKRHYARMNRPFDAYIFQSQHQYNTLLPQLERYGVKKESCFLVRAAFALDEWTFKPLPHRKGEPFVVGRISRPAPDKFHTYTWKIYERIIHPIHARIMAWSPEVEKKIGKPPQWATVLTSRAETAQEFFSQLHCMIQASDHAQENWPRSGLEAMAAGVPIVTHNAWGWKEMIIHGVTGFLADDLDEMAYYATKLAYEEELRRFIVESARKKLYELTDDNTIWQRWKTAFEYVDKTYGTKILTPESKSAI